jgi:hypothetical protein
VTVGKLKPTRFVIGLDLGQSRDFTAMITDQVFEVDGVWPVVYHHKLVHSHRFQLGTSYPEVTDAVIRLMEQLPTQEQPPELIVDATGVGRPVVDSLKERGLEPIAVTITGGIDTNIKSATDWRVPKRQLASLMQVLLQTQRLKIAQAMPLTATLVKELAAFKVKVTLAGREEFEAWREADHDDLVLAAALAVYGAENPALTHRYDETMNWVADSAEQITNLQMMFSDF